MESLWLIPVLVFILLLVFGQIFKFYLAYSPYENSGLVVMKLWNIKIQYFSFQLKPKSIVIRTNNKKTQVEYSFNDPQIKFYENLSLQINEKIKIKHIDIYSNVGTGDAAESALICGVLNVFYKIFSAYIKTMKPTCSINISSHAQFNKKVFDFSVYSKISLSLFDFLYCLFIALLEKDRT